jgi:uncharacterized protein YcfL
MARSFNKWIRPALAAGCFILAVGCAAPEHTGPPHAAQPLETVGAKRYIIAPELAPLLRVVKVKQDHGDFLKIQVDVENLTAAPLNFRYHIEWFDQDGQLLTMARGGYFSWMLQPREISSIAATAPVPAAADFGIAFVPAAD